MRTDHTRNLVGVPSDFILDVAAAAISCVPISSTSRQISVDAIAVRLKGGNVFLYKHVETHEVRRVLRGVFPIYKNTKKQNRLKFKISPERGWQELGRNGFSLCPIDKIGRFSLEDIKKHKTYHRANPGTDHPLVHAGQKAWVASDNHESSKEVATHKDQNGSASGRNNGQDLTSDHHHPYSCEDECCQVSYPPVHPDISRQKEIRLLQPYHSMRYPEPAEIFEAICWLNSLRRQDQNKRDSSEKPFEIKCVDDTTGQEMDRVIHNVEAAVLRDEAGIDLLALVLKTVTDTPGEFSPGVLMSLLRSTYKVRLKMEESWNAASMTIYKELSCRLGDNKAHAILEGLTPKSLGLLDQKI